LGRFFYDESALRKGAKICHMQVGYVRGSAAEQNTARQEVLMCELGIDRIFIDRASGKNADRPELKKLLDFVREGDAVIIESISRFARNTRELLRLVDLLKEKRIEFISKKASVDTTSPAGKFMLTLFGAMAELEREYILQRQAEGIVVAKQLGKCNGRKKIEVDRSRFQGVYLEWRRGVITAVKAMSRLDFDKKHVLSARKGLRRGLQVAKAFIDTQCRKLSRKKARMKVARIRAKISD